MAALPDNDRANIWGKFMSDASSREEVIGPNADMTKHELRDAVNAIDQWVSDNKASFNSAISQPARNALTGKQKAEILMLVIKRRWEVDA